MPATSASVERLLSVSGQVVTAKRARLDPSTVTLLVFLHEAIPGGIEREAYEIIEGAMCVLSVLIGKQKKPILFKVTEPSSIRHGERGL